MILQDVSYGLRILRKSPAFTAVAVLTLALGIGANTVVLSILNTLYRRPASVPEAEQLVLAQLKHRGISPAEYSFHRDHNRSFSGLAAEWPTSHTYFGSSGDPRMMMTAIVSANYFNVLEIQPALGRFFAPEEDQPGAGTAVVVLSDHLWRSDFGADPAAVGKTLRLNGTTQTIVGVAPAWFHGILAGTDEDLWLPTSATGIMDSGCSAKQPSCDLFENFVGRLKPGRTMGAAQDEMNALNRQWEAIHPDLEKSSALVYWARGLHPAWRGDISPLPKLLLSAVAVLLLIACANVAGLLLARGTSRSKEIAVRVALGAGRGRIVRQLLTEAALLAVAGCGLGLLLLRASQGWLSHFPFHENEGFASYYDVSLDRPVLVATVMVSALAVFVFGLLPALRTSRAAPMLALKNTDTTSGQSARLRGTLVVVQVALASTLGCAALLVVRSLNHVLLGPGFDPSHVAFVRVTPNRLGYTSHDSAKIQEEALRRLASVPGVESVSFSQWFPWWTSHDAWVALPGQDAVEEQSRVHAFYNRVAPNYLATLRITLLQGRDFSAFDQKNSPRVTIVNESLASRMWPGQSPVGQTIVIDGLEHTVVGVAHDAQYNSALDLPSLFFYVPYWQNSDGGDARFFIRTAADPGPMLRPLKLAIREIDPDVPVGEDATMVEGLLRDFGPLRLARAVLAFAGAGALFLSSIGLYGLLAFLVAQRTREIGIRMALGASRQGLLRMFLRQGMTLALWGILSGSMAAAAGARLLAAMLYGVKPSDPLVMTVVALALVIACLLASYIPARRATKVDPMVALRYE
jgi:putative ABC transport system permease protein